MDITQSGDLVKAMRREVWRQRGERWTQAELARRANATPKIISNLERGQKARIEPELLLGLANAFELTTRERAVFFECANGLRRQDLPRPGQQPEAVLANLLKTLKQYHLPAFILDDYDNVVAVNSPIRHLFSGIIPLLLEDAPELPGGYNVLRFVFSDTSHFASSIVRNKARYLQQSVYFFRFITLPYRATRFYQDMMTCFFADPSMEAFRRTYDQTFTQKRDFFFEDNFVTLQMPDHPPLQFFSPPQEAVHTPFGSLYLVAYLPADMSTLRYFLHLNEVEPLDPIPLAPWPVEIEWIEFDDDEEEEEYLEEDEENAPTEMQSD